MTWTYSQFSRMTIQDLEREKFALDGSGQVAIRWVQGISARGTPVELRADLPVSGVVDGEAITVYNDPGLPLGSTIAVWNGTAWIDISAGGSGGVNYATSPTTGNKMVYSVGIGANTIEESAVEYDPGTGTMIFPAGTTLNIDGGEVNYTGNAVVNYDNTTEINNNGATTNNDGSVTNNTNTIDNYDDTTVINNNGGTINNTDTVINNDNTVENYTNGATQNYDNTTTQNFNGTTNIANANITNLTISGSVIGANTAWIEDFVGDGVTTIFTLANLPASDAFVWVSGNGVFSQDGVALDYTVSGLNVTFNTAPTLGYKVQVHYIQSLGTAVSDPMTTIGDMIYRNGSNTTTRLPVGGANRALVSNGTIPGYGAFIKVGTTAAMAGTSLVHADADATTTSVVNWTASSTPNGFIEVVLTAGNITFNSTVAETCSFTYTLIKA